MPETSAWPSAPRRCGQRSSRPPRRRGGGRRRLPAHRAVPAGRVFLSRRRRHRSRDGQSPGRAILRAVPCARRRRPGRSLHRGAAGRRSLGTGFAQWKHHARSEEPVRPIRSCNCTSGGARQPAAQVRPRSNVTAPRLTAYSQNGCSPGARPRTVATARLQSSTGRLLRDELLYLTRQLRQEHVSGLGNRGPVASRFRWQSRDDRAVEIAQDAAGPDLLVLGHEQG